MAKIIIVDDDFNVANSYKSKLISEGYEVEIVGDVDALSAIRAMKPDLVLLDIFMPNISGLLILRELRADSELASVSVLILTNDAKASDMDSAVKLGVDGYILKAETDSDALVGRVRAILEEKKDESLPSEGVI
ncbi:response regulator transcription factor [Candidatus Curtissbacteria bacterium]|nr:response regulator transcription factor [Candidatus Curtissbacteria bacterium]